MSYAEIWLYIGAVYLVIAIVLTIVVMMKLPHRPNEVSAGVRLFRVAILCLLWFPAGITFLVVTALGIESETKNYIMNGKFE